MRPALDIVMVATFFLGRIMKKEIKIKLVSTVEELTDAGLVDSSDRTEAVHLATLAERDGIVRIEYSESTEGGPLTTVITARGERVTLIRHGVIESDFSFEVGIVHKSLYKMPPYAFDAQINPIRVKNALIDGGELTLVYEMTLGGAKKRVKMALTVIA